MTTATPEQINTALATWLGLHEEGSIWIDSNGIITGFAQDKTPHGSLSVYFDPYHRIDHAWLLVEHIANIPDEYGDKYEHQQQFIIWWEQRGLWALTTRDAARAICQAIIDIAKFLLIQPHLKRLVTGHAQTHQRINLQGL